MNGIWEAVRALVARLPPSARPYAPVGPVVMAGIAAVWVLLPVHEATLLSAGLAAGILAAAFPVVRRRLVVVGATREVRTQARLDGLAAGSLKLGPGLITIALTAIARDLITSPGSVLRALSIATFVAAAFLVVSVWRLRRRSEERPSKATVLWSFWLMGGALVVVAAAPNVYVLAVALAFMGAPLAANARYRYTALASTANEEQEAAFQTISRRWSQVIAMCGLIVLGAIVSTPLGWHAAAVAAAAWYGVLGLLVHRLRKLPSTWKVDHHHTGTQLKLRSVRSLLLIVVLTNITGQAALAGLEPVLKRGGLGDASSVSTSAVIAFSQLLMWGVIARTNKLASRSPRRAAARALLWFGFAAPAASLAVALHSWFWTLLAALAWATFVEAASGGTSQAMRMGLKRTGQITSLIGVLAGNVGNTIGSAVAGLPVMQHPLGMGAVIIGGALLCAAAARWRRTRASRERVQTCTREVVIELREDPDDGRAVLARINGDHEFWLFDGDRVCADTPHDGSSNAERRPLFNIPVARGPSWTAHALLARVLAPRDQLPGIFPLSLALFTSTDLDGTVHWLGAGKLGCTVGRRPDGVDLTLVLPEIEQGVVTWYPVRGRDTADLGTAGRIADGKE